MSFTKSSVLNIYIVVLALGHPKFEISHIVPLVKGELPIRVKSNKESNRVTTDDNIKNDEPELMEKLDTTFTSLPDGNIEQNLSPQPKQSNLVEEKNIFQEVNDCSSDDYLDWDPLLRYLAAYKNPIPIDDIPLGLKCGKRYVYDNSNNLKIFRRQKENPRKKDNMRYWDDRGAYGQRRHQCYVFQMDGLGCYDLLYSSQSRKSEYISTNPAVVSNDPSMQKNPEAIIAKVHTAPSVNKQLKFYRRITEVFQAPPALSHLIGRAIVEYIGK